MLKNDGGEAVRAYYNENDARAAAWLDRFWRKLAEAKHNDDYKWIFMADRNGFEIVYQFVCPNRREKLFYTIDLLQVERDRISPSHKANEVIESVRREFRKTD